MLIVASPKELFLFWKNKLQRASDFFHINGQRQGAEDVEDDRVKDKGMIPVSKGTGIQAMSIFRM